MSSRQLRALGEIASGVAHEFNNLLAPMMLQTLSIEKNWNPDKELVEELQPLKQAIQQATELCQRILLLGRRSADTRERIYLNDLVRNTLKLIGSTIDRRIQIQSVFDESLPRLQTSNALVSEMIINLFFNARDTLLDRLAQNPDPNWVPQIRVETSGFWTKDDVPLFFQRIAISDNGLGMTESVRQQIFQPFFTTKKTGQGTGLGLAVVWSCINSLDGKIEVESTPGQGSTFMLDLPAETHAGRRARKRAPETGMLPATPVHRSRILLVDDNELVVRSFARYLERAGHQVTSIRDGQDALRLIEHDYDQYDFLLTDLNMPGLSGADLIKAVRLLPFKGRIVVMSGFVTPEQKDALLLQGAAVVLSKPITPDRLLKELSIDPLFWQGTSNSTTPSGTPQPPQELPIPANSVT